MIAGRRRVLVGLAAAIASPALAERHRVRTVGYLTPGTAGAKNLSAALAGRGWIEGRDVRYEMRRVARDGSDADQAAADLVRAAPDVIVAYSARFVLPVARATRTIPLVCGGISDPVGEGLAQSLQKPGLNVTGLSFGLPEAAVLQLGTLRELVPGLKRVFFVTSDADTTPGPAPAHVEAARSTRLEVDFLKVGDLAAMERLLASMRRGYDAAWIAMMPAGATTQQVAASARSNRIATHGVEAATVRAGCLMSYWLLHSNPMARIGAIVDQVLRGADPAQIPFELPDKTEFVLNRATAGALGLRVSAEILLRATEVIG